MDSVANSLELFIDSEGLAEVLEKLRDICFEKAEHIRTNWQDRKLANCWERIGNRLDSAVNECSVAEGTRKS